MNNNSQNSSPLHKGGADWETREIWGGDSDMLDIAYTNALSI